MHTLTLTPSASGDTVTAIHIDSAAWKVLPDVLPKDQRIVLLFDEGVQEIADRIAKQFTSPLLLPVPSGDASKSLTQVEAIVGAMLEAGCDKRITMLCIGGGMLTDLGGFVANVFMRGVPCILMPTTLLGMVDASIGGKTAVNAAGRKNMIGTTTHPQAVIVDLELLETLPEKQRREGLAEIIKIAAMLDLPFFEWLEEHIDAVLSGNAEAVEECVLRAIEAKIKVIEQDAHDRDVRLLLNFGHTVGHAVEAYSRYRLSHGEAISIGMVLEMKLAQKEFQPVQSLLEKVGLPCALPAAYSKEELWTLMRTDKKNTDGVVRAAVPARLGEGTIISLEKDAFLALS